MDELTDVMWRALIAFRKRHGTGWRRALTTLWANGGNKYEADSTTLLRIGEWIDFSGLSLQGEEEIDAAERRLRLIATLPAMCATTLPSTHEPIVVKRGECGHWSLPDSMTIERINEIFKASPAQVEAMLVGSMFGWDVPGADPARYDARGLPRRR